jgi:hypothetical protein
MPACGGAAWLFHAAVSTQAATATAVTNASRECVITTHPDSPTLRAGR